MRASRLKLDTLAKWQLFRPDINTAHFYFFVAEVIVMSNYLSTDGLKKIFSTSGGPPEA
jgi:hypothetical protein